MKLIGHTAQMNFLEKVTQAGNLSHAYIFVGPESVGKLTVTEMFVRHLLNIADGKPFFHPDLLIIEQMVDEKTQKTKKNISIEQIRFLISFFSRSGAGGMYKVGIIKNAERLSIGAANALLKTLEEPRGDTIIFLLTRDEALLPTTIVSRSQVIYLNEVNVDEVFDGLIDMGVTEDVASRISIDSHGLPGLAIRWVENVSTYEEYLSTVQSFRDMLGRPFYEKLNMVESMFGDKSDHIKTRDIIISILDVWLVQLREMFYNREDFGGEAMSSDQFLSVTSAIDEAKTGLRRNIHPRLLVENILLYLP
jgi:DNA polymerase III subunit delta'